MSTAVSTNPFIIHGTAHGGQQPLSGSSIQVYTVGTDGDGSVATPMLPQPVLTDAGGNFSLASLKPCPSASAQVYMAATGGNAGQPTGTNNEAIAEIAALGTCASLTSSTSVAINEVTTIASIFPLARFMKDITLLGSEVADMQQFTDATEMVHELADTGQGTSPGPTLPKGSTAPTTKLYTLANVFAACINSPGGVAGDGTACGQLFALTTLPGEPAPTNTVTAALAIAKNPTSNVSALFNLASARTSFQPVIRSAPADWALTVAYPLAAPEASLASGTYSTSQQLGWTSATFGSEIYYTIDGTTPTTASARYTSPIMISSTVIASAVAVGPGNERSAVTWTSITILSPVGVSTMPSTANLTSSGRVSFTAMVTGTYNTNVTWALSPALGSISADGTYTAPASITQSSIVSVTATTIADRTKTATSKVYLQPSVGISLAPATSILYPQQTLQFTSAISGTSNSGVTWAVSSALGSVSAHGIYTAPATITQLSTVTITATSVQDTSKFATATITLMPAQVPGTFMGIDVGDTVHRNPLFSFGTLMTTSRVTWRTMNPAQGVYDFTAFDELVNYAQSRNAEVIIVLTGTPQWASSKPGAASIDGPGACAAPSSMIHWDNYVQAVASHAKGIQGIRWSLWNEAQDTGYWCSDVATMVTMAQHAWTILKGVDSTATISTPSITDYPSAGPHWLASYLAAGGGKYADAIAYHGYSTATAEDVLPLVSAVKAVSAAAGYGSLPLWNTEGSWAGSGNLGTPSMSAQVAFIPRYYLLQWSASVARVVWYAYDGGTTWGGLVEDGGTYPETAAAAAYGETQKWLVGASMTQPCASSNNIWMCGLQMGSNTMEAVWSTASQTITAPSQYIFYRDLAGVEHPIINHSVPISIQPVLLESAVLGR